MSNSAPQILIVEDHPDHLKLAKLALDGANVDITDASDSLLGRAMVQLVCPDLVILDVMMPGELDGFEICRWIKSGDIFAKPPKVLMLSARRGLESANRARAAGADLFLSKQISPFILRDSVLGLLGLADEPQRMTA